MEDNMEVPQTLCKKELACDTASPFLGVSPKKMKTLAQKDTCTLMSNAASFGFFAKTWKQPTCPISRWTDKEYWYVYSMEYYSDTKKESLSFAATWMGLESIMLSEYVRQRKTNVIWYHLYTESKKNKKPKFRLLDKIHWWLLEVEKVFPSESDSKESDCNAVDMGLIPESGRSPGEGNDYPLQYPCLENPIDRGTWKVTVLGITKSRKRQNNKALPPAAVENAGGTKRAKVAKRCEFPVTNKELLGVGCTAWWL